MIMIYFDLDGVLVNFEDWALSKNSKVFDSDFQMVSTLLQHYKEAFKDCEPFQKGLNLYGRNKDHQPKILSSLPSREAFLKYYPYLTTSYKERGKMLDIDYIFKTFAENKIEWCKKWLKLPKERVILVSKHTDKLKHCQPKDVLYDDNPYTIESWRKCGGVGVLLNYGKQQWKRAA